MKKKILNFENFLILILSLIILVTLISLSLLFLDFLPLNLKINPRTNFLWEIVFYPNLLIWKNFALGIVLNFSFYGLLILAWIWTKIRGDITKKWKAWLFLSLILLHFFLFIFIYQLSKNIAGV